MANTKSGAILEEEEDKFISYSLLIFYSSVVN